MFEIVIYGEVILVNSLENCAYVTEISINIISRTLSSPAGSPFISEIVIEKYKIKRIGVFLKRD